MIVSVPSSTPVFAATTNSTTLARCSFSPRFICRVNSQRKRGVFKNPLRVATPPSISSSEEVQEDHIFDTEDSEEVPPEKFSWRDNWYPVSLVEDLDPRYPTPFKLLNRDLVLWFDNKASEWVAFDDRCPHRLAPLSEGRIDENGHLQCSYHGWSFDGCGSCTRIPQAASEGPEARAVKSPRACATRFPAMVSQGLLFVWPDENGWERAQATKPPRLPDDFDKPEFSSVTIQRDLYYGFDTFMENVSDPSHVDFAHHKVTGKRDRAKPWPFKIESSGPWGFEGFEGANEGNLRISAKFVAPCYYTNKIEIDKKVPFVGDQKWVVWMCLFSIPMAPGKTRSIICSARNFYHFTVPGPAWWQVVPRWHQHLTSNKVYDGDITVLQGQEKIFLSQSQDASTNANKEYTKKYFTPTQSDRLVLAFGNWLRRHGNGQPDWFGQTDKQPMPSTVFSKRQMLDRYEQHTLKCSSCKSAYTTFQTLQKVLIAAAVVCTVTASIPPYEFLPLKIILGTVAILSSGLAYLLHKFQKNFVFVDYVHADMD